MIKFLEYFIYCFKSNICLYCEIICPQPMAFFTKEVNSRLAKRPSKPNGRLANLG